MSWWNETRLHQSLGYRTPVEVECEVSRHRSYFGVSRFSSFWGFVF
ncbi:hypothetical protein [Corynebacterium pseudodiphtheriticum]